MVTFSKSPKSPNSTFHNERGAEALAEAAHRPGAISVQSMQAYGAAAGSLLLVTLGC